MTEDTPGMGPALAALSEPRRLFVEHWVRTGGASPLASAQHAGFSPNNKRAAAVTGNRLLKDAKIQAAVRELVGAVNLIELPKYVAAMRAIALNPEHRDQFRALVFCLGCAGIGPTFRHEYTVKQETTVAFEFDRAKAIEELRQMQRDGLVNLLPAPPPTG
jgi:hypothetical protein